MLIILWHAVGIDNANILLLGLDRGHEAEGQEMLTQGFTHVLSMTFDDKEGITSFLTHPKHLEFCPTFSAAIDKIVVLDFPSLLVKTPPPPSLPPPPSPPAAAAPSPETVPPPALTSTPLPPPVPTSATAPTLASAPAPAWSRRTSKTMWHCPALKIVISHLYIAVCTLLFAWDSWEVKSFLVGESGLMIHKFACWANLNIYLLCLSF